MRCCMLRHHWLWRRMWKNEERKTAPRVIRIFDRRYPAWMRCLSAPWEPIRHFLSSPRALQCTIGVRRPGCAQLCIFIAPKHRPYPHHQVQKCAKICHNCIQSPSITNSRMFYLEPDRWSEDDFSIECILWLRELSHFPSSMTLFTNHQLVISLSISALWDYVIGGEMSEWAGNDLGRFSHHLVTVFPAWHVESYPYQRSDVAWSLVLVDDAVRGSISSGSFGGYWMMWNLIPWWEIEAWVKMNLSISLVVIDWQRSITLSACILWL